MTDAMGNRVRGEVLTHSWTLRSDGPNGTGLVVLTEEEARAAIDYLERRRHDEAVVLVSRTEAQALWDSLSHDAHGYSEKAQKVRAVLHRIAVFLEGAS